MLKGLKGIDENRLKEWIESSLQNNENLLAQGYQGQTLFYQDESHQLVIKVPHGRGLIRLFHIHMLKHENDVYERLSGFDAIPPSFGMVADQYLVIGYVNGQPIRKTRPANESLYFEQLFKFIQTMHDKGVAHFDLKKKDNLLVVGDDTPCLIDFGAAVIHKSGFHPFNSFWFNLAKRFDYHAWIKHKYQYDLSEISEVDSAFYKKTRIEIVSRKIKRFYKDRIRRKRNKIIS
jgi:predicted Ser/Thr protein kinase